MSGHLSLRVGRFRVVYRLSPAVAPIVHVGPRATAYTEAARIARETSP